MMHFGYFITASSGHASEYLPCFRKNAPMIHALLVLKFRGFEPYQYPYAEVNYRGSLADETKAVYLRRHALPLTAAVCMLDQNRALVYEIRQTQRYWLPQLTI